MAALQRLLRLVVVFILPIALVVTVLGAGVMYMVQPLLLSWAEHDLGERARLMGKALQQPVDMALMAHEPQPLAAQLDRLVEDPRVHALAVCDAQGHLFAASQSYPPLHGCAIDASHLAHPVHINRVPMGRVSGAGLPEAELLVLHNPTYAWRRGEETQRYLLWVLGALGISVALITLGLAHWSWRRWMQAVQSVLRSGGAPSEIAQTTPEVQPLVADVHRLLNSVHQDRRILKETTIEWRPETLKLLLREHLSGDEIMVVSNREPYIHQRRPDGSIRVQRPASGLVTAVEPVMRACSGTWIAHGSGDADAEVVDARSRIRVPPAEQGEPDPQGSYTLRRVWLSPEEERGYYFGFANEGLWPLCHIAHVRPVFREEDWLQYQRVNARFADAIVAEARSDDPVILVQDYHFALLPRMLRERLPRATIITFWHIPWPNPESFGICPWAREILQGMLGSTILGFHTRYHCQNFLETVDRFLESRITRENATVTYQGHRTKVRDYPISIHWEGPGVDAAERKAHARHAIRQRHGLAALHRLALGVDRLDYTKGILERMLSVECMLAKQPDWVGHFSLIQIAAPTRSSLPEYLRLEQQVRQEAERINARFAAQAPGSAPAIILLIEQHDSASVQEHYRACDVALVTSLHDGMNLVAKEYIASRDLEDGVLILSRFAGAAGELQEALLVNPYHIDHTASALLQALSMHPAEQRERMRALRQRIADFNIYRWAGSMLLDAADERQRMRIQDRIVEVASRPSRRTLLDVWRRRRGDTANPDTEQAIDHAKQA
ncbi:trehalose-6-phosphate synthase [Aquabacterium fontiphilum]|jgi:trehalose 6-phosphate synthase|nr:trehalose-6-phosphate synthase [Aquabacterium fontiphilum]